MLILSTLVYADDYAERVKSLKKSQAEMDRKMASYPGMSGFHQGESSGVFPTEKKVKPLFQVHNSASRLMGANGNLFFGTTVNRLVVSGEASPVLIQLKEGQGAFSGLRLIANSTQSSTPGRLNIEVQRVQFRSGKTLPIQAMILDRDGARGVEAQVISQKALAIAGALATSFISGIAAADQTVSSNAFGFETTQRSPRNSLLNGLAQTAADQSKNFINDATTEKPVLILEVGTAVTVFLQEEVRF